MQENQEVPKSPDAEGHHVFRGWLKAGLPPLEAYDNVEAIRRMAGHNIVLALESLQSAISAHGVEMAELSSKIDRCMSRIEAQGRKIEAQGQQIEAQGQRIEAQGQQIEAHDRQIAAQGQELSSKLDGLNRIIWALVAILVTTLVSFLTTAFGLIK